MASLMLICLPSRWANSGPSSWAISCIRVPARYPSPVALAACAGHQRLKIRSAVGLIPLFAVETLEVASLFKLPGFSKRMAWFLENRPDLAQDVTCNGKNGVCERRLLSIVNPEMLRRVLDRLLDQAEFLGDHGIRALSKYH